MVSFYFDLFPFSYIFVQFQTKGFSVHTYEKPVYVTIEKSIVLDFAMNESIRQTLSFSKIEQNGIFQVE